MHGLRVQSSAELSELLKPLRTKLDAAWWYLNGYGMHFEKLLNETAGLSSPGALKTGSREELAKWLQDNQEWLEANEQQMNRVINEYECWMDDSTGSRIGLPGWFSRYVDYAETCWAGYVVCESADGDPPSSDLSFVRQSDPAWEQDPVQKHVERLDDDGIEYLRPQKTRKSTKMKSLFAALRAFLWPNDA